MLIILFNIIIHFNDYYIILIYNYNENIILILNNYH